MSINQFSFLDAHASLSNLGISATQVNQAAMDQHSALVDVIQEIADGFSLRGRVIITEIDGSVQPASCKLKLDLSHLYLDKELNENNDQLRKIIASLTKVISDSMVESKLHLSYDICFSALDLSDNYISFCSILSEGQVLHYFSKGILDKVEQLNLNDTQTSSAIFDCLPLLANLQAVSLDNCPRITTILGNQPNSVIRTCQKIQKISLIRTALHLPPHWLKELEIKFPAIAHIDLTEHGEGKILALRDCVKDESAVHPQVSSTCGHIFNKAAIQEYGVKSPCMQCRRIPEQWINANFTISSYQKKDQQWVATIFDFARRPLMGRIYFHSDCHHLFTEDTLKKMFGFSEVKWESEQQAEAWAKSLKEMECPGCLQNKEFKPLTLFRVYPELISDDPILDESMQKHTLAELADFITDIKRK
jgi:hypothetical protein